MQDCNQIGIKKLKDSEAFSILQTMLDSISDGVLVVGRKGDIVAYNRKFLELWEIPESLIEAGDDNKLLVFVQNQLKRPDEFLALVHSAYENPEKYVDDILEFKNGKFFKRYSQPQKIKNEVVGRIWCFRDITERKKTEENIKVLNASLEKTNSELNEEIAERKKVEIVLRNNLQLMQTLIDSIQYPIIYKDVAGKFLGHNKAYQKLFGTSQKSLIGKTNFEIRPKEVAEKHTNVDEDLIENPGFQVYESTEADRNGELHDFSVAKSTFHDTDGSIAGIVGIMVDITERNKIESALKESEERFRAAFEQAAVGIVHATIDGKFIKVNQKFCDIVDYTQNELLNMTFMDITHDDDLQNDMGNMLKLLDGDIDTFSMEKRYLKKDRTIVWVNLTVSLIRQLSWKLPYVMGVVEDITERKMLEFVFAQEKSLLETTLISVGDGVISTDHKGNIVFLNRVAEYLTGWTQEAARGKSIEEVFHIVNEFTREKCENIVNKVLESGEILELASQTILISKDGVERPIEDSAAPIKQENGEIVGAVLVFRDYSEKKQKQQEIEFLSYHDQLTGLYNRRFYEAELNRLNTESNLPITLVMGDVNGLKLVNDSFGHAMGDVLLKKVAEVIQKGCRADDIVARLGGDEFVIILPKTDAFEAERIIKRINDLSLEEKAGTIDISISFGHETKTKMEENIQEIFKKTEDFMYKKKLFESPSMRGKTIGAIISTLHEKNKREEQHSLRVSAFCQNIGKVIGLPEREIEELKSVGLLHDIGKIAIEGNILNKSGNLTEKEWEEIKRHPEIGYRILSGVNEMSEMAEYVLAHHERWDGKGYPKGIKGKEIPFQSRIIAIADAYDAMTSERSYRDAMPEKAAIEELQKNAGIQFDPELVRVFIEKVLG